MATGSKYYPMTEELVTKLANEKPEDVIKLIDRYLSAAWVEGYYEGQANWEDNEWERE
jgi:hypothetical protein